MSKENGGALLSLAEDALAIARDDFASMLGVSKRTIMRWEQSDGGGADFRLLARKVFPMDPALAARLAAQDDETLESLGLGLPSPTSPAAAPGAASPRFTRAHAVDAIVCVAAEAGDLPPRAVRATLVAAFARARELGLSVTEVEEGLKR
jgi:hypothetical protein